MNINMNINMNNGGGLSNSGNLGSNGLLGGLSSGLGVCNITTLMVHSKTGRGHAHGVLGFSNHDRLGSA